MVKPRKAAEHLGGISYDDWSRPRDHHRLAPETSGIVMRPLSVRAAWRRCRALPLLRSFPPFGSHPGLHQMPNPLTSEADARETSRPIGARLRARPRRPCFVSAIRRVARRAAGVRGQIVHPPLVAPVAVAPTSSASAMKFWPWTMAISMNPRPRSTAHRAEAEIAGAITYPPLRTAPRSPRVVSGSRTYHRSTDLDLAGSQRAERRRPLRHAHVDTVPPPA